MTILIIVGLPWVNPLFKYPDQLKNIVEWNFFLLTIIFYIPLSLMFCQLIEQAKKWKKLSLYTLLILIICNISFSDNLKIIDGDTIILNGEKIRFSGIDAPELKQTCIKDGQKYFVEFLQRCLC